MQNSWECITSMMHSRHCGASDYNISKTQVQDVCNNIHIKQSQFVLQEEETLIGKLRCQLYWPAVLCLPRGCYTRGPTQVATGNTVFRHSSPSCTKQELTLQLSLL
ncbi:TPA: hypothetical protein ACH3X3_000183 [Trebouxia sp. C0006]